MSGYTERDMDPHSLIVALATSAEDARARYAAFRDTCGVSYDTDPAARALVRIVANILASAGHLDLDPDKVTPIAIEACAAVAYVRAQTVAELAARREGE